MDKKEIKRIKYLEKIQNEIIELGLLKQKYKNLSSCMLHIFLIVLYAFLIFLLGSIFIEAIFF